MFKPACWPREECRYGAIIAVFPRHDHPSHFWRVTIYYRTVHRTYGLISYCFTSTTHSTFIPDWPARPEPWSRVRWKWWKLDCNRRLVSALLAMITCLELLPTTAAATVWHVRQYRRCSDGDITPWAALVADTPAHKY